MTHSVFFVIVVVAVLASLSVAAEATVCERLKPCSINADCTPTSNETFECQCKTGFFGDGIMCVDSECYSFPCMNGGTCMNWDGRFRCSCALGYDGDRCQISVSPCDDTQQTLCKNDGKCVQLEENNTITHVCKCIGKFTGVVCNDPIDCKSSPCQNGGTCIGQVNEKHVGICMVSFTCNCVKGFTGIVCQEREYQSYISWPRLHFSGIFHSDVPTINNYAENFDTYNYNPARLSAWNPEGSGDWRIDEMEITRVCDENGKCHSNSSKDAMIEKNVKDGNLRTNAKLLDIDPEIQLASEIWGWTINFGGFFKGDFEIAPFQYMWEKVETEEHNRRFGAVYQSVLKNVVFKQNLSGSPIATAFQDAIGLKQELSIHFDVYMLEDDNRRYNFTFGKIVGSIGLSGRDSPPYFTYGRMLKPKDDITVISYAPFFVDEVKEQLFIDLGNALAVDQYGDIRSTIGPLRLGYVTNDNPFVCNEDEITWLGNIDYNEISYHLTAGIYSFPLDKVTLQAVKTNPVVLAKVDSSGTCVEIAIAEDKNGLDVHPYSRWIFRTVPSRDVEVLLFVTKFGQKPVEDFTITITQSNQIMPIKQPEPEIKVEILTNGICKVTITPKDPENIRKYIDGQMYVFTYTYNDEPAPVEMTAAVNTAIYLLVWNKFHIPTTTNWIKHIKPIFQQYANLYPVMKVNFMDLGNYQDVVKNKERIMKSMELDLNDPNYMPVTRDLSPSKREMIVNWLKAEKPKLFSEYDVTIETLKSLLQKALQLEHATIPPYLNGLLSIKPNYNGEVKSILRSIIIDEMTHMAQVSNILNAVGGNPNVIHDKFVLSYPSYLPAGVDPDTKVTINKISFSQIQNVYMEIEKPIAVLKERAFEELINDIGRFISADDVVITSGNAMHTRQSPFPAVQQQCLDHQCEDRRARNYAKLKKTVETELDETNVLINHDTIGEVYYTIILVIVKLTFLSDEDNSIFTSERNQLEVEGVIKVDSALTAIQGILNIVEEGEGASPCNPMQNKTESRLSHYFHFASIVRKRLAKAYTPEQQDQIKRTSSKETILPDGLFVEFEKMKKQCQGSYGFTGPVLPFYEDGVWPVVQDPQMSKYKMNSKAYLHAKTFNENYSKLLNTLQVVFDGATERFEDTMGLMKTLMVYGNRLVQTPIDDDGDPNIGPNAAPTYRMDN